ncbi:MAG: hypothetical protein M3Q97_10625 [Bacteroidota bacterium]|nr:hypothetical protein [Bacteroidota bacterium]
MKLAPYNKKRFPLLLWLSCIALVTGTGFVTTGDDPKAKKLHVLVAAYQEHMSHFSGEYFICQESKINTGELSDRWRRSIEWTIISNLADYYFVKSLGVSATSNWDLATLYRILRYQTVHSRLKSYYKGYPPHGIRYVFSPDHVRWGSDCVNNFNKRANSKTHDYTKAIVTNDSLLTRVAANNEAGYILLLNDFEMRTRFKNCLDMRSNVFQRDFFLHYTLYAADGVYLDGGVVRTTYQSNTNDIEKILEDNLGVLTGMIVDQLRKKI